ncbi:MAG: hypothetical protein ACJAUP_001310 [Cellvibrionaceae bacterium]|jgi:hypothetical protein
MTIIYVLPILFIIHAGDCYSVAKKRNSKISFCVVMASLFGPLAVSFVFFLNPTLM